MGDKEVFLGSNRPALLFSYLAYQGEWVSRDELVLLFWPEKREAQARKSLRTLLYKAKQEPYAAGLESKGNQLRWLAKTDVAQFQENIAAAHWQEAVGLYEGTFLEHYKAGESTSFEDWLEQTRDELSAAWRGAVLQISAQAKGPDLLRALDLLQAVLRYDFLAEDVIQSYMRIQALAGQTTAALKTFDSFKQALKTELELEPLTATYELAALIRDGKLAEPASTLTVQSQTRPMPQPLSPFIGRTLELLELKTLLEDPQHRLITLLGPGGMGKTRLALQLLLDQQEHFRDSIAFVSLASLRHASDIPDAVASSLALELSGGSSVEAEVLGYIKKKHLLLLFDSFEHLPEGATFVTQVLEQAPDCKLLVTSRALLGIGNEVIYDVNGLTLPTSQDDSNIEAYDAVQLFLRTARRVRSDFSLSKADYPALFELCQSLAGMPLALELAANWVRLFNLPKLLKEIQQDLDLLETTGLEVSERHQSLRKVFDYSWHRLSPDEQRGLAALSIFRGGFRQEAARTIVMLSNRTLLQLVNKSFVKISTAGRFFVLEVIRQFAEEALEAGHNYQQEHSKYYLNQLLELKQTLNGPKAGESLGLLEQDLENLRQAWQWALHHGQFDLCLAVVEPLRDFLMAKARVQEGISFFEQALRLVKNNHEAEFIASVHLQLAYFFRRLDHYEAARTHAESGLEKIGNLAGFQYLRVKILCELAHIHTRVGDFHTGQDFAEKALDLAEKLEDAELLAGCRLRLALVKTYLGYFEEAKKLYEVVLLYQRQQHRNIALLRTLSDLGRLLIDIKQPLEARGLFLEGLELAQSQNLPYELGFMWEGLSQCSYLLGNYEKAREQAELALLHSEEVADTIGIAVQCTNLAKIQLALDHYGQAKVYLKRALEISWNKQETPEILKVLLVWSHIFIKEQEFDLAAAMLFQVSQNSGAEYVHKQDALSLLNGLNLTEQNLTEQAKNRSLESLMHQLLYSS